MQTLALSLVQGPGWNGEKFNLRGEKKKKASSNCPSATPPHPLVPSIHISRGDLEEPNQNQMDLLGLKITNSA